jgi:autotransporter family porin
MSKTDMNKIYRVIWNSALRCFMVTSELAKGKTKSRSATGLVTAVALMTSLSVTAAANGQLVIDGITADYDDYQIATTGTSQYAIHVINGGDLTYSNNQATTTGSSAYAALVQSGSRLSLDNVVLGTFGAYTHVLYGSGGAVINVNNLRLMSVGSSSYGINLLGNSQFTGTGVQILSTNAGILVADSNLNIDTLNIVTSGTNSYGVRYTGAADVTLANAKATTSGTGAHGILGETGNLTGNNIELNTTGDGARGIIIQGTGTGLNIDTLNVSTQGTSSYGVQVAGTANAVLSNATINTTGNGATAVRLQGGVTTLNNANVSTTGSGAGAIYATGAATSLSIDGGSVTTQSAGSSGIHAINGATIQASNMDITTNYSAQFDSGGTSALVATAGGVMKADNMNITANGNAVWVSNSQFDGKNLNIIKTGDYHGPAVWSFGTATLNLSDSQITVNTPASAGVDSDGALTNLNNVSIKSDVGGYGVGARYNSVLFAKNVDITINNANGVLTSTPEAGIWSQFGTGNTVSSYEDSRVVVNGSNATGIMASTRAQTINLKNTLISSDNTAVTVNAGSALNLTADGSVLSAKTLLTGGQANDAGDVVEYINFTANNGSQLAGDVNIDRDFTLDSTLALDASQWQGTSSGLNALNLSNNSQWNMTGDSNVVDLNLNDSTVVFNHDTDSFKTLTVEGDYTSNGGTLVMNSILANDGSAHDSLVVSGNTSGETNVIINKAGGTGAKTLNGIEVITVGGESNGEFTQQGRIVAGAYDYHLTRGTDGAAKNWYLTSEANPVDPVVPTDPTDPVNPIDPVDPTTPVDPVIRPVEPVKMISRPEAGSYIANMAAASTLFNLRLHDRGGETQYTDAITGEQKVTSLWMRNTGGHNTSKDSSGQLDTQTNRYVLQLGGDLGKWSFDGTDSLHVGALAGYGNAQSTTDSNVTGYRSKGQVNGYSLGVYGTWYQNAEAQTGAYVDSWAQYSWFNNSVKGDGLPQESYKSKGVSASLEGGYSWKLGEDAKKNSYFIEPNAQVIWSNIQADSLTESNGTRVSMQGNGDVQSRVGVRASMKTPGENQQPVFQPYLEANWINNSQNAASTLNGVSIEQRGSKNIAEVRAGVDGKITERVNLWGNVGQQMGSENYRDTSAMLGLKVSF